jgi:uncharacterized protein (DUF1810 family)
VSDPFRLQRFIDAQAPVVARVCAELVAGHKESHWMWFIFPQLAGLGSSGTARRYAIRSLDEARAYLADPLLGTRLRECTQLVNDIEGRTIEEIFGYPDYLKFRSCMTLFAEAAGEPGSVAGAAEGGVFRAALRRYFSGEEDPQTRKLLGPFSPSASRTSI